MILILGCFKLQDEVIWKHKDCALEPVSVLHCLSPSVHADIYRMFWGRRSEVMQRFTVLSYIIQSGWAFIILTICIYKWVLILWTQSISFGVDVSEDRFQQTHCSKYLPSTLQFILVVSGFDRTGTSILIFLILRSIVNIIGAYF